MRKLNKFPEPKILSDNYARWTAELHANGNVTYRYGHKDIKSVLLEETHEKCAYCESKLRHITYGDVEHISPKSKSVEDVYRWENLTIACDVCNTNKGDYRPKSHDDPEIIDPYVVDPDSAFLFLGAIVAPRPDVRNAVFTEGKLKLNREALRERRYEKFDQAQRYAKSYQDAPTAVEKAVVKETIENVLLSASAEYQNSMRHALAALLPGVFDLR